MKIKAPKGIREWGEQPVLDYLKNMEERIMAQIDDLKAAVTALQAANAQLGIDLAASIKDLQDKLAAALASGTAPDLSGPIADIQAVVTSLQGTDTADKGL